MPPPKSSSAHTAPSRVPLTQVLVALSGIEPPDARAPRSEKYELIRVQARIARGEVMKWLKEQDVKGEYRRVSQPTAFGTFTMDCTPEVMDLLRSAPGVDSVTRISDLPLELFSQP